LFLAKARRDLSQPFFGPAFDLFNMAFNRILDFSNGLDFYPGLFYASSNRSPKSSFYPAFRQ